MENALCLFGFSGNDPNFLHWIGWVRDNLGNSTPPYTCGLLDLSSSERRYLEEVAPDNSRRSFALCSSIIPGSSPWLAWSGF